MPDHETTPVTSYSKNDETKPVAWTPEDANRFLTSAIHEAQRPLEDALKKRPITSGWFAGIIAILVFAAFAIALLLSSQLEKVERRAENVNRLREEILTEKVQLEAKSVVLEERLSNAANEITALQGSGEELRGAKNDLVRFRRQNELLRRQISGLEMEKTALARQLEAVKAMAIDGDLDEIDAAVDLEEIEVKSTEGEASGSTPFEGKGEEAAPVIGEVVEDVAVEEPLVSEEAIVAEEAPPQAEPEPASVEIPAAVEPEPVVVEEIEIVDVEIPVEEAEEPAAEIVEAEPVSEPEPVAEPAAVEPAIVEPAVEPAPVAELLSEIAIEPIPEEQPAAVAEAIADVEEPVVTENFEAASEAYGEQLAGETAAPEETPVAEVAPVEEQEPAQEEQTPAEPAVDSAVEIEVTPEEVPAEIPEATTEEAPEVVVGEPRVEML